MARRFWFADATERQEIEANCLVHAIERIDRFKFRRGKDAFAYYSSLAYNRILRQLRQANRQQAKARLFTDVDDFYGWHNGSKNMDLWDAVTPYTRAV